MSKKGNPMTFPSAQQEEFLRFLLEAKQRTYAAQGDEATVAPLLAGSRQLEWREGEWLYRDIYYGMAFFVGQETVFFQDAPVWSMSYAGGVAASVLAQERVFQIYRFLRSAMRQVSSDHPFRGPSRWQEGEFVYTDQHQGEIGAFWGSETITFQGESVYDLHYSGGFLR
jgi:hypothetical protein